MEALRIGNVEKEYEKLKQLRKEDVLALKEWVSKQPHLPQLTEMQIILFLHSNNFSNESAKRCIDNFYTCRTHAPELFANRDPKNLDLDLLTYIELPKTTPKGHRVIFGTLLDKSTENYSFSGQMKLFDMSAMLMLNKRGTSDGQHVIHNLEGLSLGHIARLNLPTLKKFFYYLQEAMPVKLVGLHFVNTGTLVDRLLGVLKPFMKKELVDILYTHPEMETLYEYVPKECLPSDLGGSAPSILELHRAVKEDMYKHAEFFKEEEKQIIGESRRPGKPKDAGEVFGVEGSFRKLDID